MIVHFFIQGELNADSMSNKKEEEPGENKPWEHKFTIRFFVYPNRSTTEPSLQDRDVFLELDDNKSEHQIREQLIEILEIESLLADER